jgi:hypothetical protein
MDAIEERRRQLFAELRELNRKIQRVSKELGDLDRGQMPPDRFDDNFIPPFLRKNQSVILRLRRRKVA